MIFEAEAEKWEIKERLIERSELFNQLELLEKGDKKMSKKILLFDCETTGLDPNRNGLIQLAMIMDIDGKIVDELQVNIRPFNEDMINLVNKTVEFSFQELKDNIDTVGIEKLAITEIAVSEIDKFICPQGAIGTINKFLQKHINKFDKADKAYIGGYNLPFDTAFVSEFYEKCGDKYLGSYINWKQIDVRQMLYMLDFEGKLSLENYKLSTACDHFGIELEAHNPMSDIKATRELFYIIKDGNYGKDKGNETTSKCKE